MVFYADDSMAKVYGDSKYTGGKDGSIGNWPGTGGKPALEIPSSMFFFRWQTDGSVSNEQRCRPPVKGPQRGTASCLLMLRNVLYSRQNPCSVLRTREKYACKMWAPSPNLCKLLRGGM